MKILKYSVAFLFISFLFQNCKKNEVELTDKVDWFAFSLYHCECWGNCSSVYKIENEKLFERQDSSCVVNEFGFNEVELSRARFEIAEELLDALPEELLDRNNETFGCPDCGDWGGHIVAMKKDGIEYTWNIDNATDDLPAWLLPFKMKMDTTLAAMQ